MYYACKRYNNKKHRRRNEGEIGAEGAHVAGAREDETEMEHSGIDDIMKYDVNAGTYRTVKMFKDGMLVHKQLTFGVFLRENSVLVYLRKELLDKGSMYVVLPKMVSDRNNLTGKRLDKDVELPNVMKFLMNN